MSPDAKRRPGPTRLVKFCLGWLIALAACAVVEAAFRLAVPEPEDAPLWVPVVQPQGGEAWRRSPIHIADPYLFWRNRPNVDVIFRGTRVRTNEHGMRGEPVTKAKPPGVYRILSLGESTAFGERVEQGETYAAVLEQILNARHDGRTYQVLNAGAPGYSLVQSLEYLRRRGLEFAPDAILIYHGYNDFLPTSFLAQRLPSAEHAGEPLTDLAMLARQSRVDRRAAAWFLAHSRALQWVRQRLQHDEPPRAPVAETLPATEQGAVRVPEADRRRALSELADLAQRESAALVILVPCYADFDQHRAVLLDFARQRGTPCLDLETAVQHAGGDRRALFADRVHPGARLHRAIAEEIADFLATRLLGGAPR